MARTAKARDAASCGGVGDPQKFGRIETGTIVEPAHQLRKLDDLRELLPADLKLHPAADAFLLQVQEIAAVVLSLADDRPAATPSEVRERLSDVAEAGKKAQRELLALAGASDVFSSLDAHFTYLRLHARRQGVDTEGSRPAVPVLPPDVPDLPALLARIDVDLEALRVACQYAAQKIKAPRSVPNEDARRLVLGVAEAYREQFGSLPESRRWFARVFMDCIGDDLGMPIGHSVVDAVLAELS